jgi:hypothetical protein
MTTETITATIKPYDPDNKLAELEHRVGILRDGLEASRKKISELYVQLNDIISDNEHDKDDTITFGDLGEILASTFGNNLLFKREFLVTLEVVTRQSFKVDAYSGKQAEEEVSAGVRVDGLAYYLISGDVEEDESEIVSEEVWNTEEI